MQDIKEEKKDKKLTVDVTGGGGVNNIDDDGYIGSLPNTPTDRGGCGGGGAGSVPPPARLTLASSTDDMGVFTSSEEVLTAVPPQAASSTAASASSRALSKVSDDGVSLQSWESGSDEAASRQPPSSTRNTVCTGAFSRAMERYNSTIGLGGLANAAAAKPAAAAGEAAVNDDQEPV